MPHPRMQACHISERLSMEIACHQLDLNYSSTNSICTNRAAVVLQHRRWYPCRWGASWEGLRNHCIPWMYKPGVAGTDSVDGAGSLGNRKLAGWTCDAAAVAAVAAVVDDDGSDVP